MLNFLIIGDWGRRGSPEQRAVACGMARVAAAFKIRFVVAAGDNFYDDGVQDVDDPHWQESFEAVYTAEALRVPWYVALGNHDYRGCVQAQIDYTARSQRWHLPGRHYAIEQPIDKTSRALLIFLDTTPFLRRYHPGGAEFTAGVLGQDSEQQLRWLQKTLAASRADWKLVIAHHPIYSASPFHGGALELQRRLLPVLHEQGVQAYFCGHEHDLQHLESNGIHHVLSGSAAECRLTGVNTASRFSASCLGFAAVSVTLAQLQLRFYQADAKLIYQATLKMPVHMNNSRRTGNSGNSEAEESIEV